MLTGGFECIILRNYVAIRKDPIAVQKQRNCRLPAGKERALSTRQMSGRSGMQMLSKAASELQHCMVSKSFDVPCAGSIKRMSQPKAAQQEHLMTLVLLCRLLLWWLWWSALQEMPQCGRHDLRREHLLRPRQRRGINPIPGQIFEPFLNGMGSFQSAFVCQAYAMLTAFLLRVAGLEILPGGLLYIYYNWHINHSTLCAAGTMDVTDGVQMALPRLNITFRWIQQQDKANQRSPLDSLTRWHRRGFYHKWTVSAKLADLFCLPAILL